MGYTTICDSYSTQKIYVIFVTSHNTKSSWGALMEVGAAWITQVEHKIFNIYDFRPEHPLDDEQQWHSSSRDDDGNLYNPSGKQGSFVNIGKGYTSLNMKARPNFTNQ